MAATFGKEVAIDVTGKAVRLHGGYGCTRDFPVGRYFRDAKTLSLAPLAIDAMSALKKGRFEARPRADFRTRGRVRELFSVESCYQSNGWEDAPGRAHGSPSWGWRPARVDRSTE